MTKDSPNRQTQSYPQPDHEKAKELADFYASQGSNSGFTGLDNLAACYLDLRQKYERLRTLAKASLDARNEEARATMTYENAAANFSDPRIEGDIMEKAIIAASIADQALRDELGE